LYGDILFGIEPRRASALVHVVQYGVTLGIKELRQCRDMKVQAAIVDDFYVVVLEYLAVLADPIHYVYVVFAFWGHDVRLVH
jgi:hypothetical protein